jgi:hypothetical protein
VDNRRELKSLSNRTVRASASLAVVPDRNNQIPDVFSHRAVNASGNDDRKAGNVPTGAMAIDIINKTRHFHQTRDIDGIRYDQRLPTCAPDDDLSWCRHAPPSVILPIDIFAN